MVCIFSSKSETLKVENEIDAAVAEYRERLKSKQEVGRVINGCEQWGYSCGLTGISQPTSNTHQNTQKAI